MAGEIIAYKGFNSDLTCRDFQYEVGQTYHHDGEVSLCGSGFHACEHPLHVLKYYDARQSRFCEVRLAGKVERGEDKLCSASIEIQAEISLSQLIERAVEFVASRAKPVKGSTTRADNRAAVNNNDYGAATASGRSGAAAASGWYGVATASGWSGAATASGWYGAATASGESGAATASGWSGAATASGWYGVATASGESGAATASGRSGAATASGRSGAATASGWSGAATASGRYGVAAASGWYGVATASGRYGAATASGWSGVAAASGWYGVATATHKTAIAHASFNGKARAVKGAAIHLDERDPSTGKILHVFAGIAGKGGVKPDTWYCLKSGKLTEAAA